jgi:hypothetical protein
MLKQISIVIISAFLCIAQSVKIPEIDFNPEKYICCYTADKIVIDGADDEKAWDTAEWTKDFVDIKGRKDSPTDFRTRVKMLWDKDYFYVFAELEEHDVWGSITQHDDTIYNNNNFEVFIDPDGDTHNYFELELNALNTTWDLVMIKPYRDMDKASLSGWEMKGMESGVKVYGTINKPGDKDSCWTVEAAFPWESMKELTSGNIPPAAGEQWRVNFARAEWKVKSPSDSYIKMYDSVSGKPLRSFSVWSPQGLVNLHYPEMWGYVQFDSSYSINDRSRFIEKKEEAAKWYLRRLYYAEKQYYEKNNTFTSELDLLNIVPQPVPGFIFPPHAESTRETFVVTIFSEDNSTAIKINNEGRITTEKMKPGK